MFHFVLFCLWCLIKVSCLYLINVNDELISKTDHIYRQETRQRSFSQNTALFSRSDGRDIGVIYTRSFSENRFSLQGHMVFYDIYWYRDLLQCTDLDRCYKKDYQIKRQRYSRTVCSQNFNDCFYFRFHFVHRDTLDLFPGYFPRSLPQLDKYHLFWYWKEGITIA